MKNLKKNKHSIAKGLAIPVLTFVLLAGVLVAGADHFRNVNSEQGLALAEQAIRKAVLQCYAVEGLYPSSLDYLVDHYNLKIDREKYFISYDCIGSNVMPQIYVFER